MLRINISSKCYRQLSNCLIKVSRSCSILITNKTTMIENIDHDPFPQRYKTIQSHDFGVRYFMKMDSKTITDVTNMSAEQIDDILQDLLSKNRDQQMIRLINECIEKKKLFSINVLKRLFRYYSMSGRVDIVEILQKYSLKLEHNLHLRNGEFMHYIAKAQCMKGNSEHGLSTLKQAYVKFKGLRSFYRIIFKELIYDSVLNRSEASLVIFKKYVLQFSEQWNDHYPLICYWHVCWSSSWFSDQMTSNELLDTSHILQDIVRDKATIFSINILREYNEDAVVRLLQSLLKYNMMVEYAKVLQILFHYKLKNKDLRGCTEIIKNCEALGISLPSDQQGKYIKMLIYNKDYTDKKPDDRPKKPTSKSFKLKF